MWKILCQKFIDLDLLAQPEFAKTEVVIIYIML